MRPFFRAPGGLVHDIAQESVQHEQCPQRRAMVAHTRLMLIHQLREIAPIEKSGIEESLA
jgi:hypothetical protein